MFCVPRERYLRVVRQRFRDDEFLVCGQFDTLLQVRVLHRQDRPADGHTAIRAATRAKGAL
jgi:hypothetical protein